LLDGEVDPDDRGFTGVDRQNDEGGEREERQRKNDRPEHLILRIAEQSPPVHFT
jgi:hypothetical protein